MADLQEMVGLDLEAQTNPRSLAKCKSQGLYRSTSGSVLALPLNKQKNRKVPWADISCRTRVHFMFLYRQILVPPGDFGAFLSLWWI